MEFIYENNIDISKVKKSSVISVVCNRCGLVNDNCTVKNYIKIIEKVRIINDDTEITGLYLCRSCSKSLQDTNKSIVEKANISKAIFYLKQENRLAHSCKDPLVKKELYKKMVNTVREKYGSDYYREFSSKSDRKTAINTRKINKSIKDEIYKDSLENNLIDLESRIFNGDIKELSRKNKLHKEFIRRRLGIASYQYINEYFYDNIIDIVLTNKIDDNVYVLKNTNINRKSNGSVKRGWVSINNLILKYESQIELSYILYKKDEFINRNLVRNNKKYLYSSNKKYYPDFYDVLNDINIEIKDIETYKKDNILIDKKLESCNSIIIFNKDIPDLYKNIAKTLINEYEQNKEI